ncbi:MAG TPA: hypothetical protein VFD33_02735 [Bacillota bacterium]|nr:hypothetical protein [Bacillota bacterium]
MRGLNLKPITFIVISMSIVFLITAPLYLPDMIKDNKIVGPSSDNKPEWTGVISLWYVPYLDTAGGSQVTWMNNYIRVFEKQYPGVFIDLKVMSSERLSLYFYAGKEQDILPDMVTLATYDQTVPAELLLDLSTYFSNAELDGLHKTAINSVMVEDSLRAIPWMIGAYGLYINNLYRAEPSLRQDEELIDYDQLDMMVRDMYGEEQPGHAGTEYFAFSSYITPYTRPLLSIIYAKEGKINNKGYEIVANWLEGENICSPDIATTDYSKAFNLFATEKRTGVLLGSNKVLYDLRKLEGAGKGMDFTLYSIPYNTNGTYQDQVAAMGILDGKADDVKSICVMFLKGLLEENHQKALTELGMFSVMESLRLYDDDKEMSILEESLTNMTTGPFGTNKETADRIWNDLIKSSQKQ